MIAAVLKDVAEVISTDEALCRLDVRRIVPEIEDILAITAERYRSNNVYRYLYHSYGQYLLDELFMLIQVNFFSQ